MQLSARIFSDDFEFKTQIGQLLRASATPVMVATDSFTHDSVPPDLLVADVRGDVTAAMQTVEKLRARVPSACIFAVALEADPNLILKAMRAGVNEFLVWPPNEEAFSEALRRALHRRDAVKEAVLAKTLVFFGAK